MSSHGSYVFTNWLKALLTGDGIAAEIGVKPKTVPAGKGWAVIYPIAGGIVEGTLDNPYEDATPDVQITCAMAQSPSGVIDMVDDIRALIQESWPATLSDGRRVIFVEPTFASPQFGRDEDVSPPVFWASDRFSWRTTG